VGGVGGTNRAGRTEGRKGAAKDEANEGTDGRTNVASYAYLPINQSTYLFYFFYGDVLVGMLSSMSEWMNG
jgi:hypothetical protein